MDLKKALKHKAINGWGLVSLFAIPISILVIVEMLKTDMSAGEGVSHMIGYSVRFAIPFIYLVVAASSFHVLFPGPISMWWMRNRKYIGFCFAAAMAWQGLFILILSTFLRDYYFSEVYFFRDELEGTIGYLFLVTMVVTSFHFGRKYVSAAQWNLIHKGGVYFLWAYPFSVYWWNLSYYPTIEPFNDPRILDYIFYWGGFLAFALRIAAWGKTRRQASQKLAQKTSGTLAPGNTTPLPYRVLGGTLIAFGLIASATGLRWQDWATSTIAGSGRSEELVLWLPYWPLEPFLPLLIIGLGTLFWTKAGQEIASSDKPAQTAG